MSEIWLCLHTEGEVIYNIQDPCSNELQKETHNLRRPLRLRVNEYVSAVYARTNAGMASPHGRCRKHEQPHQWSAAEASKQRSGLMLLRVNPHPSTQKKKWIPSNPDGAWQRIKRSAWARPAEDLPSELGLKSTGIASTFFAPSVLLLGI